MVATLDTIKKSLRVDCSVEHAFRTFTEGAIRWWPLESHSLGGRETTEIVWEGEGGRVLERFSGMEGVWGRVLVWEPPHRLVMTWHPGRPAEEATELEIRFSPDGDATLVEVEHRGWDRRGPEARQSYDTGWDDVLEHYRGAAARS